MKFQDSSFNGLKVTVGTKSVTHPPTHAPTHARSKSNMSHQLFQSWGHNKLSNVVDNSLACLYTAFYTIVNFVINALKGKIKRVLQLC